MCILCIVIHIIRSRLLDLIKNKVEVSGYHSIVLRLRAGLPKVSILEGAGDFSYVRNVLTRSRSWAALCSRVVRALFLFTFLGVVYT